MAYSANKVILLGRLGKDADTKFMPSGTARTVFSIATDRRQKNPQTGDWETVTDWHNIVLWKGEQIANHLTKGKMVYIEGRLQTRKYEDKYITEVVAESVVPCSAPAGSSVPAPDVAPPAAKPKPPAASNFNFDDDDVPF